MKLAEFFEFFWKEMLYLKFKIMMKPYFHLYLTFLSRQQDNDDANDDENDIDIFSQTDKHRTYEMPQRKQIVHHESIRPVNYRFSSTLSCNTFTFYFSCHKILEATWNGDNNFLKIKKHISLVFQFEKNLLRNGLSTFKFFNSQKARPYVLF